ncbi:Putative F-box domain, leucine-rich repeat domain superfamily [Septoria linicola]|uniref:F-box domain, leucine-rich repeat domain superfamily n=1 Tax=Septoria linicola TaxID=215465 RepID=A0A9Q9B182_9PEZI|nr:putative F-box domain, leucine-rich repeat domain superfamily [Septoria linicola]USW56320.1 Putative F-box domain, leucine-rich repeat domain superfamily [Septoria linicola]
MRVKFMLLKVTGKLAAMNTVFQFPLLDLPNELIALVIEQVDNRTTLRKLSRTCRRVQELTEPVLYRYALVSSRAHTRDLLHSLRSRSTRGSARAKALHTLDVPCNWRQEQSFADLARLLESAIHLKRLMIEAPECNHGEFEDADHYEEMTAALLRPFETAVANDQDQKPLQKLQELVLHLNGPESPYWSVDERSICLFMLPSLQRLKLSCVNIEDDAAKGVDRKMFTSLKHLVIEEANITHRGLMGILSLPQSLETLYLGENCHNIDQFADKINPAANHLFNNNPAAALEAIGQQKSSLRELVYVTPERNGWSRKVPKRSAVDAGFANFHYLESITLHGTCVNFERAVVSSRSPPMLKELIYKTDNMFWSPIMDSAPEIVLSLLPFVRAPSSSLPTTLEKLRIISNKQHVNSSIRQNVRAAAKILEKHGVVFQVAFETRSSYFPPYLYGEPLPVINTIFDGKRFDVPEEPVRRMWAMVED